MKKINSLLTITATLLMASVAFAGVRSFGAGTKSSGYLAGHKKNFLSAPSYDLFHRSTNLLPKGDGGGAFAQGKVVLSVGYGFPNLWKEIFKLYEDELEYSATGMGPIHFRGEYGLSDNVGFVGSINYVSAGARWITNDVSTGKQYENNITTSSLSALARINFHFSVTEQLDPYFGVGAGYRQRTWKFTSDDPAYADESAPGFSPFGFETTIGLRFYFTESFGIYTEMGIAKSVIQGGLVVAL